jgi:hypothetical protein
MSDPDVEHLRKVFAEHDAESEYQKQRMRDFTKRVNEDLDRLTAMGKPTTNQ